MQPTLETDTSELPWHEPHDPPIDAAQLIVDTFEDPDGAHELVGRLVDEYGRYCDLLHHSCPECPSYQHGMFVVNALVQWKASYADGELGSWTASDIHEFMFEYVPRKVSACITTMAAVPHCIRDFVYFLTDRGTIDEETSRELADVGDQITHRFLAKCADRGEWGPAKQLFGTQALVQARVTTTKSSSRRTKNKGARAARRRNR